MNARVPVRSTAMAVVVVHVKEKQAVDPAGILNPNRMYKF